MLYRKIVLFIFRTNVTLSLNNNKIIFLTEKEKSFTFLLKITFIFYLNNEEKPIVAKTVNIKKHDQPRIFLCLAFKRFHLILKKKEREEKNATPNWYYYHYVLRNQFSFSLKKRSKHRLYSLLTPLSISLFFYYNTQQQAHMQYCYFYRLLLLLVIDSDKKERERKHVCVHMIE